MYKLAYSVYETDVDHAYVSNFQAQGDLNIECARQGSRRVAQAVATWFRETMGMKASDELPVSLQQVLVLGAPD